MNRIDEAFKNKPIFMPYYPLGYPDLETSIDVIEALAKNGARPDRSGAVFLRPAGRRPGDPEGDPGRAGKRHHHQRNPCKPWPNCAGAA